MCVDSTDPFARDATAKSFGRRGVPCARAQPACPIPRGSAADRESDLEAPPKRPRDHDKYIVRLVLNPAPVRLEPHACTAASELSLKNLLVLEQCSWAFQRFGQRFVRGFVATSVATVAGSASRPAKCMHHLHLRLQCALTSISLNFGTTTTCLPPKCVFPCFAQLKGAT